MGLPGEIYTFCFLEKELGRKGGGKLSPKTFFSQPPSQHNRKKFLSGEGWFQKVNFLFLDFWQN